MLYEISPWSPLAFLVCLFRYLWLFIFLPQNLVGLPDNLHDISVLTSDLGLETANDSYSLVQDHQLGLGLFSLKVIVANLPEFLERFIYIPDPDPACNTQS